MQKTVCRWGILGTAEIAHKNWQAIRNASNCSLTAVASRDVDRCQAFIGECQRHTPFDPPPIAYGSYEELLASDAVDAVYMPLPTGIRKAWVIRAAEAGKHVLAEKPSGVTSQDVQEMLAACRQSGVQFMDGVMFMHSRRLESIRRDSRRRPNDRPAQADHFAFHLRRRQRFFRQQHPRPRQSRTARLSRRPGLVQHSLHAVGNGREAAGTSRRPHAGRASPPGQRGRPHGFFGRVVLRRRRLGQFLLLVLDRDPAVGQLGGTKGLIYVPDFVLPRYGAEAAFEVSNPIYNITGCDFNMEEHTRRFAVREYSNSAENAQETNMFRRFAELVLLGRPDPSWGEMALKTQQVLDACLRSARSGGRVVDLPG